MRYLASLLMLALLSGCGLQPALEIRNSWGEHVKVSVIAERLGQQLRTILQDYFPGRTPHYQLKVFLETQKDSIMIGQDATTRRYQLSLKARFELDPLVPNLKPHSSSAEALASYNLLNVNDPIYGSADFSNVVAQEAATERALMVIVDKIRWQVVSWLREDRPGECK